MPLSSNIRDLSAMPERRVGAIAVDDEITVGLRTGLELEETEGIEIADGELNRRRKERRDRARSRGLKQVSRSTADPEGRVVLTAQWYREQPGDLRRREQPREHASAVRVPEQPREQRGEVRARSRWWRQRLGRRG